MRTVIKFTKRHSDKISYIFFNYFAYLMNFASGLILARGLGPENRGIVAYLSNLFLITLIFAPLNAKNASSIAEAEKRKKLNSQNREFSTLGFTIISTFITLSISIIFYYYLIESLPSNLVVLFCIANLFNSLAIVIQIREGILRTQNKLHQLAIIRFLGYATPSFFIFILFFAKKIEIEYVIFGQVVAMLSTSLFVIIRKYPAPEYSHTDFSEKALKTFASYFLEVLSIFTPLMLVMLSEQYTYIGLFAIAYGFSLISDTYFQIVESKVYFHLAKIEKIRPKSAFAIMYHNARSLFFAQLIFIPFAFLIPILYGKSFSGSVQIAIFLILFKYFLSILKIESIYINLVLKRYLVPIILNGFYVFISFFIFLSLQHFTNIEHPWILAVMIPSVVLPIMGAVYILFNSLEKSKSIGGKRDD
jgi:O-antigen/teichoic acid export membrane protein